MAENHAAGRSYALACAFVVAAVIGLFVWQPWNANGDALGILPGRNLSASGR